MWVAATTFTPSMTAASSPASFRPDRSFPMTAPRFTAACVQMRSTRDPLENRDAAVAMIREAADRGADFVQTPEMTSLVDRDRKSSAEKIVTEDRDPTLAGLREV